VTQTGAFLVTLAIEVPVVVAGAALFREPKAGLPRLALLALGANAVTHPLLWIADSALAADVARPLRWTVLELAVVAVEGAAYTVAGGLDRGRAFALAIVANATSFAAGLVWVAATG
jgi:hypothetical protein